MKLVPVVGIYAIMRMGNLFESPECFGRSFCWLAAVRIPFCMSCVYVPCPFHCASLPAGMVINLCIWMVLFSFFAPGVSSSFSWASIRSIVDMPQCADSIAFLMATVASVWDEGSGVEFGAPAVIASMPLRSHLGVSAVLSFSI